MSLQTPSEEELPGIVSDREMRAFIFVEGWGQCAVLIFIWKMYI